MLRRSYALYLLVAIYIATSGVLILATGGGKACSAGFLGGWAACDQTHHLGLINYFIGHPGAFFGYPDPWLIANLPGFHLLVAAVARLLGYEALGPDTWLRLIPFGFGAAVLWCLWRIYHDLSGNSRYAALLCLPVLWSNYFYLSSLYLVTENAAYLGYAFLLLGYLRFAQRGLAIGLVAAGMVSARQIFLPIVGAHILAVTGGRLMALVDRSRIRAVLFGTLPPIAVVTAFFFAWHGFVPPDVARLHASRSILELGPIAQAIALLGVLAVPYALLARGALQALCHRRGFVIGIAAIGAAVAFWLIAPTTRDLDAGRAGSFLWLLARFSPAFHDRAVLALPCFVLGFGAIAVMIELARSRHYVPLELVMLGLYVGALSMQLLSYQRYSEVVTLITLSATVARLGVPTWAATAGFCVVFLAKLAVTLLMPQPG